MAKFECPICKEDGSASYYEGSEPEECDLCHRVTCGFCKGACANEDCLANICDDCGVDGLCKNCDSAGVII